MRLLRRSATLVLAAALGVSALTGTSVASATASAPAAAKAAATPQEIRVVTANVTYKGRNETQREHRARIARKWSVLQDRADVVLFQETRDIILSNVIDTNTWAVRQRVGNSAARGSSIVVRRSVAASVGSLSLTKGVGASGCTGGGIGTRYIARVDVRLTNGRNLKLASAHLPPKRCWGRVYDTMANRIVSMANNTEGRLIIGADWNKGVAGDPNNISGRTGLKRRGVHIDGFYLRPRKTAIGEVRTINRVSNHTPVQLKLTFR